MTQISIDPQAIGWRDDGTESGILRTKSRGNLVQQPFLPALIDYTSSGSSSVNFNGAARIGGAAAARQMFVSVSASGSLNNGVTASFIFHGPTLGLVYQTTNQGKLGCRIDGVAYDVPLPIQTGLDTQASTLAYDTVPGVIVADDLSNTLHYCQLDFACDPLGVTAFSWYMMGYLVDETAGYRKFDHASRASSNTITLTTSATFISAFSPSSAVTNIYGAHSFLFINLTASAHTVSLLPSGSGTTAIPISVPASGYAQFTPSPGVPLVDFENWKVSADANSSVAMTIIGAV